MEEQEKETVGGPVFTRELILHAFGVSEEDLQDLDGQDRLGISTGKPQFNTERKYTPEEELKLIPTIPRIFDEVLHRPLTLRLYITKEVIEKFKEDWIKSISGLHYKDASTSLLEPTEEGKLTLKKLKIDTLPLSDEEVRKQMLEIVMIPKEYHENT